MNIEQYFFKLKEKEADENLSNSIARQKAKEIGDKVSKMIGGLK